MPPDPAPGYRAFVHFPNCGTSRVLTWEQLRNFVTFGFNRAHNCWFPDSRLTIELPHGLDRLTAKRDRPCTAAAGREKIDMLIALLPGENWVRRAEWE